MSTIFISGTDTGVGKTTLTCLLLAHLRSSGIHALGMKPFCSGSRHDAEMIQSVVDHELDLTEINPFYFVRGIAPWVAARLVNQPITLAMVLEKIRSLRNRCEVLIVEGAGGLLSPLGEGVTARELIRDVCDEVIIVAPNKLGVLNHARLTAEALPANISGHSSFVMMDAREPDESSASNHQFLVELVSPCPVHRFPRLNANMEDSSHIEEFARDLKDELTGLLKAIN